MIPHGGLVAFPITPADVDGRVDTGALRSLVLPLREAEVDAIGLLGSTGSFAYLTRAERRRAVEAAADEAAAVPLVVGVGALRTDEAIDLAQDAKALGAAAGLLAAVSYTPLGDDEVFEHITSIARGSGLPIILYDNPSTTHFRFTPPLVARLAKEEGVIGIKSDAAAPAATAAHLATLRAVVPARFSLGYSSDWFATEALILGADAWYSVLGGLFPNACKRIVDAVREGDADTARKFDASLAPIWALFKTFGSLRVTYAIAELLGRNQTALPRPVLGLGNGDKELVREALARVPHDMTR